MEITTKDVYTAYRVYKHQLKTYQTLPKHTWEKLMNFFKTKNNPRETFLSLLSALPNEMHTYILSQTFNIPQEVFEVFETLKNFEYPPDDFVEKFTNNIGLCNEISCDEIEYIKDYYSCITKDDVAKLLNWIVSSNKQTPLILKYICMLYANEPATIFAWFMPWYFQQTGRFVICLNNSIKTYKREDVEI